MRLDIVNALPGNDSTNAATVIRQHGTYSSLVRILAATDLHYRLGHYDWLVEAAAGVGVVALSGDLADISSPVPLEVQIVVLQRYLERLGDAAIVLAASGNHDLDGPGPDGEQAAGWLQRACAGQVHTDGSSVDVDGYRFTVCPWWDGPLGKQRVADQLVAAAADRPAHWIWLYHAPPAGTVLCFDGRREFPDNDLASWIAQYQPDMVLTGHIHQAPWTAGGSWHDAIGRTQIFNAGKQIGTVPPHIIIDTDTGRADWFGVFDSESVALH